MGAWTVNAGDSQATGVSVSPSATAPQTFTFTYSDPDTPYDISATSVVIGPSLTNVGVCFAYVRLADRQLFLAADNGVFPSTSYTLGTTGVAQNSQCAINAAGSSVAVDPVSGTVLLKLSITFVGSFANGKSVYLKADEETGTSAWSPSPLASLIPATVTSSPPGRSLTVDGVACTAPCSFLWTAGSPHTIAAATQAGATGTQYVFANWSDTGAASHTVTAPSSAITYTAAFTTQYYLTTAATAGGTVAPASGWYNAGGTVAVSASANTNYQLSGFSGALTGSASPQNVTMNSPLSVTAGFTPITSAITIASVPVGLALTVDNLPCATPCSFQWTPSSLHTLAAVTQSGGAGVQFVYANWSDNGTASHTVTAPSSAVTYTAAFTTQYYLTTSASPNSGGTVLPVSGWYNSGAPVTITASAAGGYQFAGFSGNIPGTTTPQSITMNAPATVAGSFTVLPTTLTIASAHSGAFQQGDAADLYTLIVTNSGPGPTNGTIATVTDTLPAGLIGASIAGTGWTCAQPAGPCTRADILAPGASYPPITLTVKVTFTAAALVANSVTVVGGVSGGSSGGAADPTTIAAVPRYANPLAFATTASVVGNVPTTFIVTYASANGAADIVSGQVRVDSGQAGVDSCYFGWDSTGNVTMYAGTQIPNQSGHLGDAVSLYTGTCTINLRYSTLAPVPGNADALNLNLAITFPQQSSLGGNFVGQHAVSAWGTSATGFTTSKTDLGALIVSSGADFTISVTPADSDTIILARNTTTTVLITATGLNGFNGSIPLGSAANGSTCFSVGPVGTIQANTQKAISVTNSNCTGGETMQLVFGGAFYRNGFPNSLFHTVPSSPTFKAGTAGDFGIIIGNPSAPVLSSTGSVSFPITVQSINGQSGTVSLSISGVPAGATYQFDDSHPSVPAGGIASTTLTLTGSAAMPGGTFHPVLIGTLNGAQRTASFGLGTQVTTFHVTSAVGSGIVHNTAQEVQFANSVPDANAPSYTTCTSPDPEVTCRVVSAASGTVTLGVTASKSATPGTRVLTLNGATPVHASMATFGLSGVDSVRVQAGGPPVTEFVSVPESPCYIDGACGFARAGGPDWVSGFGGLGEIDVTFAPPANTPPGSYTYWVDACPAFYDSETFDGTDDDAEDCSASGTVDVTAAAPTINGAPDPSIVKPGRSGIMTIDGTGFTGASVEISGTGLNKTDPPVVTDRRIVILYSVDSGAVGGDRQITIRTPGGFATTSVTVEQVIAIRLELLSTVISTDGKYTEDSTIRVTAVDANTRAVVTTFTGAVNIAEDGTSIYTQHAGNMGPACLVYTEAKCQSSVTISSGGTATFVAKSLADPKTEGPNGTAPDPAKLKATDFPMETSSSLPVPQWITSGTQIDPLAIGSVFDWLQSRMKDIFTKSSGTLRDVLLTVKNYSTDASLGTAATYGSRATAQSPMRINPFYSAYRTDSAQSGMCEQPAQPHALAWIYYHEARHAYQFSLTVDPTNDEDRDFLLNNILIAPVDVIIDTTAARNVCDELTGQGVVTSFAFKGKANTDAFGDVSNHIIGVGFAIEMDAHKFASQQ